MIYRVRHQILFCALALPQLFLANCVAHDRQPDYVDITSKPSSKEWASIFGNQSVYSLYIGHASFLTSIPESASNSTIKTITLPNLQSDSMKRLRQFKGLSTLRISGNSKDENRTEGLAQLTKLTHLQFDSSDIRALLSQTTVIPQVRKLRLTLCSGLERPSLMNDLHRVFPNLQSLMIDSQARTISCEKLSLHKHLNELRLSGRIGGNVFDEVGSLRDLTRLELAFRKGRLASQSYSGLKSLETLKIHGVKLDHAFASFASRLPNLVALDIRESELEVGFCRRLQGSKTLRDLNLCADGNKELDQLASLPLQQLTIESPPGKELAKLRSASLESLTIYNLNSGFTARLDSLESLPKLHELLIFAPIHLNTFTLLQIRRIESLESLGLEGPLKNVHLAILAEMPKLKALQVSSPHIDDQVFGYLAAFKSLEYLGLNSSVTSSGVQQFLGRRKLRSLMFGRNVPISVEAVVTMEKRYPTLRILHKDAVGTVRDFHKSQNRSR